MTDHPPTLVDLAALDVAASVQIPDWETSVFACSDGDKEYGEAGVLFPSAPDEAGMTAVTDFLIASKGAAPRLLEELRALPRYDLQGGFDGSQWMGEEDDGDWIKVSDLLALLGSDDENNRGVASVEDVGVPRPVAGSIPASPSSPDPEQRLAELEERLRALAERLEEELKAFRERGMESEAIIQNSCIFKIRALLGEAAR